MLVFQSFQNVEESNEEFIEQDEVEKSPLVKTPSLRKRKSTRGSSFAVSEGDTKDDKDKKEEVRCGPLGVCVLRV